jgi:hypothetical protein
MSAAGTSRDRLLRCGAATLAGGALVGAIGSVLRLIYVVWSLPASRQVQVSTGLGLVAWALLSSAFACGSVAFSRAGRARATLLRVGALLVAGAYLVDAGGYVVLATRSRLSSADRLVDTGYALPALALAVAALIAAAAFNPVAETAATPATPDRRVRDGRLRWAAITVAVGSLLLTITTYLEPRVIKVYAGESYTGIYVAAGGEAIKVVAGVAAARAFRLTGGHQRERVAAAWQARDRGLSVAAALLAGAYLVTTIGGALQAASPANGPDATYVASLWLGAGSNLVYVVGVGIASAGFWVSSRTGAAWRGSRGSPASGRRSRGAGC